MLTTTFWRFGEVELGDVEWGAEGQKVERDRRVDFRSLFERPARFSDRIGVAWFADGLTDAGSIRSQARQPCVASTARAIAVPSTKIDAHLLPPG